MLGRPHESAFPLVAHLWRLPQGERWWLLPESLLLTKTPAETRSRSQKPSMKIPQLFLWVHTGQHRGGKRLQSHVEDWGLCPLQQRPKGQHSAQRFPLALEGGGFVPALLQEWWKCQPGRGSRQPNKSWAGSVPGKSRAQRATVGQQFGGGWIIMVAQCWVAFISSAVAWLSQCGSVESACEIAGADYVCVRYGGVITANKIISKWGNCKQLIMDTSLPGPQRAFKKNI